MRISDWSSDVCSSDLLRFLLPSEMRIGRSEIGSYIRRDIGRLQRQRDGFLEPPREGIGRGGEGEIPVVVERVELHRQPAGRDAALRIAQISVGKSELRENVRVVGVEFLRPEEVRSEEHTSELQSLMRISYSVFCWKKKKKAQETI